MSEIPVKTNPPATNTADPKVVLITGCSTGIGYCVAMGLQSRGYQVFATARKPDDVQNLKRQGLLNAMQLDLDDSRSLQECVSQILSITNGRIDVLFNNGAYGQPGAVEDLRRDVLRAQLETNLLGTMELTNLVIPAMRKNGFGRIIQNSSILGFIALPYRGAYNTSKYALEGLSDTLRLELNGTGIHVSLIEPGPIESQFRKNAFKAFQQNIDRENSPHRQTYANMEKRLTRTGHVAAFTLPPEAVLRKVIHAIESTKPKAHYYVTFPTYLFATLKRILTCRAVDRLLLNISRKENR